MTSADPIPYPFTRPAALEPPRELLRLSASPTVPVRLPSGDDALLVTRHADIRALLVHPAVSRNLNRPGAARISKHNSLFQDSKMDPDPPEHTRVRRLVMRAFTPARVAALEPYIGEVADELLDAMAARGGPVDLNQALAYPLTIRVLCRLLGVPAQDEARFRGWTEHFLSISRFPGSEIGAAMREMNEYIEALIETKRTEPGDDLISAMIAVHDADDGELTGYELQWWSRLLLLVGYETTASQIGGTVALLLSRPDQLARLREDPNLVANAVEEALRWKLVGSSVSMLRYTTADIAMDGYTIPAGTSVIPAVDAGNFDPVVFARPEHFDITREHNDHLTLSRGPHYCIGAGLARAELVTAIAHVLDRFPTLRLAVPATELRRQDGALLEGFLEIPVEW